MSGDALEKQRLLIEERRRSIDKSVNAVHIDYYSPFIGQVDLDECERELQSAGLRISSFNKSGVLYASLEDYANLARVILNDEITKAIVWGAAGNLFWESIKGVTKL
ncbi:MAG: hypothetical protein KA175_03120 [Flavobacteriales bacterium]|nr:hypothetical protein [Flavobacteriales bacterium]